MDYHMKRQTSRASIKNANTSVPEWITTRIIEQIDNLSDSDFKNRYLKSQLTSKFVSESTAPSEVRRTRAINKWLAAERNNEGSNVRIMTLCEDFRILPHVSWRRFGDFVRDLIADVLGDVPPFEALIGSFSGGASTSKSRTSSQPAKKYLGQADVTEPALEIFRDLLPEMPGWGSFLTDIDVKVGFNRLSLNTVKGNILFTVPKNADIDRCACKEPDINMFLQKGLGSYIRRSLRRVGINLNDQSRNRALARQGSIDRSLATLDLSSASDSICIELVREFLPLVWFNVLDDCRSHITIIDGHEHRNEMFSSMGNGFTFELESLLFWAIAKAVAYFEGASGVVSVYGDDIIVPNHIAENLSFVLGVLGFEVNPSKSFWTGSFRESCGGHYINGFDVTPFYIREPIKRLTDLIHILNEIRRWSVSSFVCSSGELDDLWNELSQFVPRCLWGGRDYGSIYQLVSRDLPKKRLVPLTEDENTLLGGYVHWLNTTWLRGDSSWLCSEVRDSSTRDAVFTSRLSKVETFFRLRPATFVAVHSLPSPLLSELA